MLQQFISSGIFIGAVAVIALLESLRPAQRKPSERRQHIFPNVVLMFIMFATSIALNAAAVIVAAYIDANDFALFDVELPLVWSAMIGVICLDFFAYLAHRLMHYLPWMWRVHRVHHSDLLVDVTTAYRQHPLEAVWRFTFTLLPSWLFGIPPEVVLIYRGLSAAFAILEHVNIEVWLPLDTLVSRVFVTPNLHKIHHSETQCETDSNYGNILTVHDQLLGTYTSPQSPRSITYGLNGFDAPSVQRIGGLLMLPFRKGGSEEN